jgi:hypothetical protein
LESAPPRIIKLRIAAKRLDTTYFAWLWRHSDNNRRFSPKTIVLREISFLSQLWRINIMTGDTNKLPILEILFSTGTNDDEEQISTANLPTLTVVYDGERYSIVEGSELIEMALAESFRNLEQDFYTVLRLAVDLRRVEANSNHS